MIVNGLQFIFIHDDRVCMCVCACECVCMSKWDVSNREVARGV